MIFFSQYHAFHAYFTHRDLNNKQVPDAIEGPESVPMLPYQPETTDPVDTLKELRGDLQALVT